MMKRRPKNLYHFVVFVRYIFDIQHQGRRKLFSEGYDGLSHITEVGIYFPMSEINKYEVGDANIFLLSLTVFSISRIGILHRNIQIPTAFFTVCRAGRQCYSECQ